MREAPRLRHPPAADDWVVGDPAAPLDVVAYVDLACPASAQVAAVLDALLAEYPDALRLVVRHFPVSSANPRAAAAAEAAECAGAQGRFWTMATLLLRHRDALEPEALRRLAARAGCDLGRFDRELARHAFADEVRRDFRRGVADGVNRTPTLFVGGLRHDGAQDHETLRAVIAAALRRVGETAPGAADHRP